MRDPRCANYRPCLADHARVNLDMDCQGCGCFIAVSETTTAGDVAGAAALVVAVLQPALYKSLSPLDRLSLCYSAFISGVCDGETP